MKDSRVQTTRSNKPAKPSVEIIYAGGTISSLATPEGYREGGHAFNLIGLLEERSRNFKPNFKLKNKQVAFTGLSENMDERHWAAIDAKTEIALGRCPRGVLITHGTDSMEQTARHLQETFTEQLRDCDARIILTGANDTIEQADTDAWDNLRFGLESAAGDTEPGVYVAFHDRLIPADEVAKLPYVKGGEVGFISRNDPLYVRLAREQQAHSEALISKLATAYGTDQNEDQAISYDVNTIRPDHQSLVEQCGDPGLKAVLLTLYHSGTANTEDDDQSVATLVEQLRSERPIVFFAVTETGEPVDLRAYETSVTLRKAGVVPLYDMLRDVALAKLRLADAGLDAGQLIDEMISDRCGEIDGALVIADDIADLKRLYGAA